MLRFNSKKSLVDKSDRKATVARARRRALGRALGLESLESRRLMHATDGLGSALHSHSPVVAEYSNDSTGLQTQSSSNVILSSQAPAGTVLIQNAPGDPLPSGNQFYLSFRLNWQGDEREHNQVLAKLATQASNDTNQITLWQFQGTDQVQLLVTVNGVLNTLHLGGALFTGASDWLVQVTNAGQAQLFINGTLRGQMTVGNISSIPRTTLQLGGTTFGAGTQIWGEYSNVRADVDGDAREDIVQVPPARYPVPFTTQPIPNLPNPNPTGFLNTAQLSNANRNNAVPNNSNSIIDAVAGPYAWKGDVIAFAFNKQDIDSNGIGDFDEGGWRDFYTNMLKNVTELTGVQFWEQPEGVGTIEFKLYPGGGGYSGTPGLGAAPTSGTSVGINGTVQSSGELLNSTRFTHVWFHETGHALGLFHPHDYELPDGLDTGIGQGFPSINRPGDHFLNTKLYTSVGYQPNFWGEDNPFTPQVDFGTNFGDNMAQSTYLPFDIAALQHLYGINRNTALGDNLYSYNDDHVASRGLRTIWDNGGNDTIQYTGTRRSVINLNDATLQKEVGGGGFLSTSEQLDTGFLIANGVVIENAIGGDLQDFITGNEFNNRLTGNGGDDTITGNAGDDTLIGGAGNDLLDGGAGTDTVELSGSLADYTFMDMGGGVVLALRGGLETDTLRDVELLRFASGQTIPLAEITNPPVVSISPNASSIIEGNAGQNTSMLFTVSLSRAMSRDVTANVTISGNATGPATITIPAGSTSVLLTLTVAGDNTPEPNETITATLSNLTLGTAGTLVASQTVVDNDDTQIISVASENFSTGATGWSNNTSTAGYFGRFAAGAGTIQKNFAIPAGTQFATVQFDFLEIDSWENEILFVTINGQQLSLGTFSSSADEALRNYSLGNITGQKAASIDVAGLGVTGNNKFNNDNSHTVRLTIANPGTNLSLGFSSNLNSAINDESFGIDNLFVTAARSNSNPLPGTIVASENFNTGASGWSNNTATDGFFGQFGLGSPVVEKTFSMPTGTLSATVQFDFLEIDSWDNENFYVTVNGLRLDFGTFNWSLDEDRRTYNFGNGIVAEKTAAVDIANIGNRVDFGTGNDNRHTIRLTIQNPGTTLRLGFSSNLNQAIGDEAFGIDNLVVTASR